MNSNASVANLHARGKALRNAKNARVSNTNNMMARGEMSELYNAAVNMQNKVNMAAIIGNKNALAAHMKNAERLQELMHWKSGNWNYVNPKLK
jgi:hypothetical protein